jgi:hypothetical protein
MVQRRGLRTPDAAQYVGLRPGTLERLRVVGGGPPYIKIGRVVVYDVVVLDAWLDAHFGHRDHPDRSIVISEIGRS